MHSRYINGNSVWNLNRFGSILPLNGNLKKKTGLGYANIGYVVVCQFFVMPMDE